MPAFQRLRDLDMLLPDVFPGGDKLCHNLPQFVSVSVALSYFVRWTYRMTLLACRFLEGADGNIIFTSSAYEPEAVAAVKSWFAKTGRTAYACGPLLPSASKVAADAAEKAQSKESDEIETFLDNILRTSGKQTLLYVSNPNSCWLLAVYQSSRLSCVAQISLGSIFWPKKAENIWAFLDIVMELGIPFVSASSITICHLSLT